MNRADRNHAAFVKACNKIREGCEKRNAPLDSLGTFSLISLALSMQVKAGKMTQETATKFSDHFMGFLSNENRGRLQGLPATNVRAPTAFTMN
jgi:hypothetical protein